MVYFVLLVGCLNILYGSFSVYGVGTVVTQSLGFGGEKFYTPFVRG